MSNVPLNSDAIKHRLVDPATVLHILGLLDGAKRQARGFMVRCVWHQERTGSLSVTTGPGGALRAFCFGCGMGGDVYTLASAVMGKDLPADFPAVVSALAAHGELDNVPPLRPLPPAKSLYPLDAARIWDRCGRLQPGEPLWAELTTRAIDPAAVRDADLARVLPDGLLPRWCRAWQRTGHRLIVPLHDAAGNVASLHGRTLSKQAEGQSKGRFPTGYTSHGLLMADATARDVLATGTAPWWNGEVLIGEGATDFLALSCRWGDSAERLPATLGIYAGAWSAALAARIPRSAVVRVMTHPDAAGHRYAQQIAQTLSHCRAMVITQPIAGEGQHRG